MLKLKNVSKYYYKDGVIASGFTKVNLELHLGEFVVITGESGSGKSTLLNVLSGLDSYEDGEMYINGQETSHYTEEDYLLYRRKYVSNIFQNFNLVNSYTVYQNIELAMLMNGKSKKEIKKYVNDLIEKVGLKKYRNTLTSKLSGGQKQRVAIARALANDTPIIVADEPTGALDSKASANILKLLYEISKDKLVIVVTHNKAEIEAYATRLIRMHDGKILENKEIKKINSDNKLKAKEVKNITFLSKLRLGIRNAFNIPIKFVLMVGIFLLITLTLISNYAGFQISENEELSYAYTNYFIDDSDYRIVVKKEDKTAFTSNDYSEIKKIDNVDHIVENDLLNDYILNLSNDNLYISGTIKSAAEINQVSVGRLPLTADEIVIKGSSENWYISNNGKEVLNVLFQLDDNYKQERLKVVGIIYDDDIQSFEFYAQDEFLNKIKKELNANYSDTYYYINNKYNEFNFSIITTENVAKGTVYLKDTYNYYCPNFDCKNVNFSVKVENIYYQDKADLIIKDVYTKENSQKLVGYDYNQLDSVIFMNPDDYDAIYNKGNYQSSIYVKEIKDIASTVKDLKKMGYTSLAIRDAKQNDLETIVQIIKIFKLIVTLALIITLFFISYFIIKIIYKSRNSYYTTLRTLGSTKSVCVKILMLELITLATITYTLFLMFISLVKKDFIQVAYFKELAMYVGLKEYFLVYLILILISVLMSLRYGRKIFKESIIKTYGERL